MQKWGAIFVLVEGTYQKKKKIVLVEGGARRRAKSRGMWAEVVKILTAYNFSIGSA